MKVNRWTSGLLAAGVVSLASVAQAEEAAHQVLTAVSSTTLSGYVSTSAIWKFGTGNGLVGRSFDGTGKQDGFNLDVINLTISKALDESEWSAGYKAELLFGPDANTLNSSSIGFSFQDVAIKQAYVNLRAPVGNGLELKLGVWDTPIGYEVLNAGENPNYSRSYGYALEPAIYTGLMLSYKAADAVSFYAAVADAGTATTINSRPAGVYESQKTYMAGFTLTAPDDWGFLKGSTLSGGVINHATGAGQANILNYYVGSTLKTPLETLTVGASFDYQGRGKDGNTVGTSYYSWAADFYASFQATEKLKINTRAEYASSTGGFYYAANPGDNDPNNKLFAVTGTLDYSLWANVITRAEVRWDSALTGEKPFGGTNGDKNAISLAFNVIYKF